MPLVQYTWQHPDGNEVRDTELFPFTNDIEKTILETVPVFQRWKDAKLLKVESINPIIHCHKWVKVSKFGERVHFKCEHCGVTAWRRFHYVKGVIGAYNRDDAYKSSKYETCRSPLKEMPASTKLF
jgi:hypothetical protein